VLRRRRRQLGRRINQLDSTDGAQGGRGNETGIMRSMESRRPRERTMTGTAGVRGMRSEGGYRPLRRRDNSCAGGQLGSADGAGGDNEERGVGRVGDRVNE
jgi:hypothetical protein